MLAVSPRTRRCLQARLLKQLVELLKTHLESRSVSAKHMARAAGACEGSFEDLLELQERQCIASLPEQPPAAPPRQQQQRVEVATARTRQVVAQQQVQSESSSGDAAGAAARGQGDAYEPDSFLVDDDASGDGYSGGETASEVHAPARLPRSGSKQQACDREQEAPQRAWNAAGLRPGQTAVLVSPGMHTSQQEDARRQEQQQQPEHHAAAAELRDAEDWPDSPAVSADAVAGAMQLAGGIMGDAGSDGAANVLPPETGQAAAAAAAANGLMPAAHAEGGSTSADEEDQEMKGGTDAACADVHMSDSDAPETRDDELVGEDSDLVRAGGVSLTSRCTLHRAARRVGRARHRLPLSLRARSRAT